MKSFSDTFNKIKKAVAFSSDDSPTDWLTKAYIIAFVLIALLTFFSHNMMSHLTARQIEGKQVSYELSQAMGVVRQIGTTATTYYNNQEEFDRDSLLRAVEKLKQSQKIVDEYLANDNYSNDAKKTLYTNFYGEPFHVNDKLNLYFKTIDGFLFYSPTSRSSERQAVLATLNQESESTLPRLLDIALTDYQSVQIEEMQNLHQIQGYVAICVIIVLVLEAMFIFRPLARKVGEYQGTILRQALEDPLTGLKNRRAFMQAFETYEKIAAREKHQFVFALCDLDKFKSINDTHGHAVGDAVLKHFSKNLQKSLRPSDIVARIGGEEFAIILTKTNLKQATFVLDRVRDLVEKSPCRLPKGLSSSGAEILKYTTSIGFVIGRHQVREHEELFRLADEGLYAAKQLGRNRIHEMKRQPPSTDPSKVGSGVTAIPADPEAQPPVKH